MPQEKHEILTDIEDVQQRMEGRADEINVKTDAVLVERIVKRLKTLIKKNNLIALSAPQIGYRYRIFCINFNGDIRAFINPMIVSAKGLHLSRETCDSLPGKEYIVPRSDEIIALYQIPAQLKTDIQPEQNRFIGAAACIFQQMTNILDGVFLSDFGLEVDENYDALTEEEQEEIIKAYADMLKQISDELNTCIQETPELKQQVDAIKFMSELSSGKITVEKIDETEETPKDERNN